MNDLQRLFDEIGSLARRRYQVAERSFMSIGLNHTEARLLNLLAEAGGQTAQDTLSKLMHIDRSNVGRALKKLEDMGLVSRGANEADKRGLLLALTEEGRKRVGQIREIKEEIALNFFGRLTEADART